MTRIWKKRCLALAAAALLAAPTISALAWPSQHDNYRPPDDHSWPPGKKRPAKAKPKPKPKPKPAKPKPGPLSPVPGATPGASQ